MKKLIFPCWILFGVMLAWPAFGYNELAEVSIRSDRGHYLPAFPVASEQPRTYRAYVEAVRGERYSVRVVNRSPYRLGLVIAVDGRNIISGIRRSTRPPTIVPTTTAAVAIAISTDIPRSSRPCVKK